MRDDSETTDNFIIFPTVSGGGALVRRSQIAGGRPNGQDGAIIYLTAGPSVYTSATILQVGRYLGAETALLGKDVLEGRWQYKLPSREAPLTPWEVTNVRSV